MVTDQHSGSPATVAVTDRGQRPVEEGGMDEKVDELWVNRGDHWYQSL